MKYEEAARLARLQRYIAEHPGALVGYDPGEDVYCPGRRLIEECRGTPRPDPPECRSEPRTRPCGYRWGRVGPETTVYVHMIRSNLPGKRADPSLGAPPPLRAPAAFFKCPDCECEIEFVYYYRGWMKPGDSQQGS
jgi:hypothetical protein